MRETKSKPENLLAEIRDNKEIIVFGRPVEQNDAEEPRYELQIIGPERLVKALMGKL